MHEWKFKDPPNLAVITNKKIISQGGWIAYVSHDEDDGAWQFHGPEAELQESDAVVVGLGDVVKIDPSIMLIADLPLGWHAWRNSADASWQIARMEQNTQR